LPDGFDGYKIVQVSDLHGTQFGESNSEILRILRDAEPDMIAVTGDIVDRKADIPMLYDTAAAIASIAPTYFVPGNHEYGTRNSSEIFNILENAGLTVLRNQSATVARNGDEIKIVGIDDPNGPADMMPMEDVIGLVRKSSDAFILMLNHRYDRLDEYSELNIPFVLTGHAHGGLIRLPFTDGLIGPGGSFLPKYTNGIYKMGNTVMLTSRGIGNASFSLRLFNRPHIPVITLKCKRG
jgi:predicted MPP superfamily phosphohydrolase